MAQSYGSQICVFGNNGQEYLKLSDPESFVSLGNLKVGTISEDRVVVSSVMREKNLMSAIPDFNKEVDEYLSKVVFVTQGSMETDCGMAFYKEGSNFSILVLPFYSSGGSDFYGSHSAKIVECLTNSEVPSEFYKYWRDASMTNSYSGKLLLMFSALEALVKNEGKNKYEKLENILGKDLKDKIFKPNGGLRHRLVHGEYHNIREDVSTLSYAEVHKKVIQYFKNEVLSGVDDVKNLLLEDFVSPQRSRSQLFGMGSFLIRSHSEDFNVVDILQYLKKRVDLTHTDCFIDDSPYFVFSKCDDENVLKFY